MSTVLITGGHGFIGQHLARWLSGQGNQVVVLGHGAWTEQGANNWGMSGWINGSISASNLHSLATHHGVPDTIYHLAGGSSVGAAIQNPREDFFRTVTSTVELLEWLRQENPLARVIAVSSAAVYGSNHNEHIDELAVVNPYSPYGHHKLMMESLFRSYGSTYGIASVVARLFSVYGSGLRKQLLWDLCTKLATGRASVELGGTGNEVRDWTDVRDVVRALSRLGPLACAAVPTINVGSGEATTVRTIAARASSHWHGGKLGAVDVVFSGQTRAGDPFSLVSAPERLRSLGFEFEIPVPRGIAEYVEWFKTEGTTPG